MGRRPYRAGGGALLPLVLLAVACSGEGDRTVGGWGDGAWHGTVDTLASGVPVVRNPAAGAWSREDAWRIEEELRVGSRRGPGVDVFSRVTALAVDDYGRIWVAHGDPSEIRVFGPDGRHVRTLGGEGEGPREFGSISGLEVDGRGRALVVDFGNNRYAVWDTAGRFLATHPRPYSRFTALPWFGGVGSEGRLWDIRGSPMLPDADREAMAHDTAFEAVAARPLPMPRDLEEWREPGGTPDDLILHLDPPEAVWFSRPGRPRIVRRRLSGDTARVIDWDVEPPRLSEEERRERLRGARRRLGRTGAIAGEGAGGAGPELSDIPEREELYGALWVDDRRHLWAPRPGSEDGGGADRIHVFDPRGRYLGPVLSEVAPDLLPAPVFGGGTMWAVIRDSVGVEHVVRARIVRPGEGGAGGGSGSAGS